MRPRPPITLLLLLALLPPGCARFPEVDARLTEAGRKAPAPDLVDIRQITAQLPQGDPRATETEMIDRADALRSQAAVISLPVLSDEERGRLTGAGQAAATATDDAAAAAERQRLDEAHARLRRITDAATAVDTATPPATDTEASGTDGTATGSAGKSEEQQKLEDANARLRKLMLDAQGGSVAPSP